MQLEKSVKSLDFILDYTKKTRTHYPATAINHLNFSLYLFVFREKKSNENQTPTPHIYHLINYKF